MARLNAAQQQAIRTAWIAAALASKLAAGVDFPAYQKRFARSLRSYYRDLDLVQRAGVRLISERDHQGRVVFAGFSL
jgi:predicted DNA-binding transcriptional regulator YafY